MKEANEAMRILTITTQVALHHPDHDVYLRQLQNALNSQNDDAGSVGFIAN